MAKPIPFLSLLLHLFFSIYFLACNGDNVGAAIGDNISEPTTLLSWNKAARGRALGKTSSGTNLIDVRTYGAKGDGSDATRAFSDAWKAACSSTVPPILLVPKGGTYLLKPIIFSGSCKSSIIFKIQGTILASPKISDWNGKNRKEWIEFNGINNLNVEGGGTIDGNGKVWWKKSCKVDKSRSCTDAPTAVTFDSCNNLRVGNLKFKNSQKMHLSFAQCNKVVASHLSISAPSTSPNTDGIHVTRTKNILIRNCAIATGDDCISIVSGSNGVTARNIVCGPGHGISIGSLGKGNSRALVSNVLIDTASLSGTTNGARIKTWQGGRGYAKNIVFRNMNMKNVKYPIIIDQNYCDSSRPCKQQSSAVAVSDVKFKNIKGTSATDVSIMLDCSKVRPCQRITLEDISLVKGGGKATKSFCNHVKISKLGKLVPKPCA